MAQLFRRSSCQGSAFGTRPPRLQLLRPALAVRQRGAAPQPARPRRCCRPRAGASSGAGVLESGELPNYSSDDTPIREFGFNSGFANKYDMGDKLGAGTFGTVRVAIQKETGERFAVKTMPKRFGPDGNLEQHFARRVRNEIDICNHLGRSLNVCYLYETFEDESCVDMVMELCIGGQLWDRILRGKYGERQAARLMREVLRTIAQCHAKHVMLRDVKPENFLFLGPEEDSTLKAVDFGISIFCQPGQYVEHRAGTPIYLAPEVVRQHYSLSADLWSAGILAYLLLTGRLPFSGEEGEEVSETYMAKQVYSNKDVFRAILYSDLDFESPPWDSISADAKDFVESLLERDEALRPSAEEALQHRWLEEEHAGPDVPLCDTIVQRLQRFGTYGRLKQVALRTVAHGIAADSSLVSDLMGLFRQLDEDNRGKVPYSALRQALEDGHFALTPSEAQQLMAQIDIDDSGDIQFDEWIASLVDWRKIQDTPEWETLVQKAFDALDSDHCGRISMADLEHLLCGEDGCEFPDIVSAALREADINHDGGIDLPEFKRLVEAQEEDNLDLYETRLTSSSSSSSGSSSGGSYEEVPEGKEGTAHSSSSS